MYVCTVRVKQFFQWKTSFFDTILAAERYKDILNFSMKEILSMLSAFFFPIFFQIFSATFVVLIILPP